MNSIHEKSLQLIEELLNSMDDETFLSEYQSVKCGVGPTVETFLVSHRSFNNFLKTAEIVCEVIDKHCEIKEPSYKGQNCVYSAENEISQQLAA